MAVDDWSAADAAFAQLIELSPELRRERLASLELSASVRALVERLIEADEAGTGLLDRERPSVPEASLAGRRLGRWELEEEIGRGGMSVVYRAHSVEGPSQLVAIKLLTLGGLVGPGAARFEQEQAVLARLRHPHIATLFEAGIAPDGTPWLAMTLVDGVRIDAWCEQRGLGARQIGELMLGVCDAVAYAHRNLVIHRDLKPSNVLVDDDGHVRLLDFGIARLADEAGEVTATQWRALTPEYAAPEQFTGAPASTAMDVYGLGALLYRLLTGRPPRAVGGAADAPVTAPSRAARAPQEASTLRGDLDAVLTQALAFDPGARYESTAALTQDLRAWLEGRPVAARGPGMAYRLAKLVARHRVAVAAGIAVVAAILFGLAGALWQADLARTAAGEARAEAERAREQAERATATKEFVLSLFEAADPEQGGGPALDSREMLRRGAARIREESELADDLRVEILGTIGAAQRTLGWYEEAEATLAAGEALAESLPPQDVLVRAALAFERAAYEAARGRYDQALERLEEAAGLAALRHDEEADALRIAIQSQKGNALAARGRSAEALEVFAELERMLARLPAVPIDRQFALAEGWGVAAYGAGDYELALEKLQEAYRLQLRQGNEDNASLSRTLNHLSGASAMLGRLEDALRYDGQSLALARRVYPPGHTQIAGALYAYGDTLRVVGRYAEAQTALEESEAIYRGADAQRAVAMVQMTEARTLVALGRYAEAFQVAEQARPAMASFGQATGVLQLLIQEIAALVQDDPGGRLPRQVELADDTLASLTDDTRWHPVAQYLRWRLADADYRRGDLAAARQRLGEALGQRPPDAARHVSGELVLSALDLRLQAAEGADRGALANSIREVEARLLEAEGPAVEALAYGWLAVRDVARHLGDQPRAAQAIERLVQVDRERTLPAEYRAALPGSEP